MDRRRDGDDATWTAFVLTWNSDGTARPRARSSATARGPSCEHERDRARPRRRPVRRTSSRARGGRRSDSVVGSAHGSGSRARGRATSTATTRRRRAACSSSLREDGTPVDEAALAGARSRARPPAVRGHAADPRHRRAHDGAAAPGPDRLLRRGDRPGGRGRRLGGGDRARRLDRAGAARGRRRPVSRHDARFATSRRSSATRPTRRRAARCRVTRAIARTTTS